MTTKKRKNVPKETELVVVSGVAGEIASEGVVPYFPELPVAKYLEGIELNIIQRIENLAQRGKLEDAVRLRANQSLWNKIRADKSAKTDSTDIDESPYEALLRRLEERKE